MYREFVIPHDDDRESTLGVTPVPGDEVGVRSLTFTLDGGAQLTLTVDMLGLSATLLVTRDGKEWLRITREGATELKVSEASPEILLNFRTEDTTGRLEVTLWPTMHIVETALFT